VAPAAFGISYGGHLLAGAHVALLAGDYYGASFLLFPVYVLPPSPGDTVAPWIRLLNIYQHMETHPQIEVIVAALLVFVGIRVRAY
jgi:hypothetical protein